jgi:hypothetical protein
MGNIGSVIGLVSKAKELADKLKNLELKEVIVDLQSKLLDVKEEINGLREENTRLTEELKRASAPAEVTMKDGAYFRGSDGPFCTACYDTGGKLVRVADATHNESRLLGIRYRCPACKAKY